jgi:spermidine/putrescine transport system permease protein
VRGSLFGRWLLPLYSLLALILLLVPVVYTIVFSFNASVKSNILWKGFTLDNWTHVCAERGVCASVGNSLIIGIVATVIATAIGTLMAIALVRFTFRGRALVNILLFLPMATPEVVLGAGLAAQFLAVGFGKGIVTIIIAHVLFCISFVVVTVKARVASLDPALEEAARDLYGSSWQVFWLVTFPLLLPGILAAALLSFSLSFDDFIITRFNNGGVETFPIFVYTAAAKGVPAEANVVASAVFVFALIVVIASQASTAARRKRLARLA